ncbi:LOW QUALITY PROTEIN: Sodium/calcium exchanger membrane region [Cinnamomum micranthum f. kanehirae]|uniref:Sodium/calcium exchanger membrane region n=1 Tax=Cinnamomum micranthum f. kanehirae TaxID=337451 RepID=A0A3S3NS42_9MAGN|nr:LOW QUALITY PROTEIN: Sodium/calcium exchanger membrane region [Cinnamomum micranthum f. kanehirae]
MARLVSTSTTRKFPLFLNISFLFLFFFYFTAHVQSSNFHLLPYSTKTISGLSQPLHDSKDGCMGIHKYPDNRAKCAFLRSEQECQSQGYIDYLQLFYYTAASYFCSSLEGLSVLSPTIAGVTLLSLGNGANDVFSSIVSFTQEGAGEVGLNSVLGGTFFISSVVVGIISILVSSRQVVIDKSSFIRDVCFFILVLCSLLVILIVGRINIWIAAGFTSLYAVYVIIASTQLCTKKDRKVTTLFATDPLLPTIGCHCLYESTKFGSLGAPLLVCEEPVSATKEVQEADNRSHQTITTSWFNFYSSASYYFGWFLYILELPIYLPRRLTIPVVCEERWSKPFAVISVTLAPVLLAALWSTQELDIGFKSGLLVYICGGSLGTVLGVIALVATERSSPPKKFLFPWLAGGFLMSVIWTYIIAEELVALLVSLGNILGISPSILGLTVLAWGNSIGDLISDVALATKGGSDGAQIAITGCYAGPIFNTLLGLGLSLVLSSWQVYPSSYEVPKDSTLFQTLGFLVGGLLWALIILPRKGMKLDRVLGCGLLAIYLCFLSLRLAQSLGLV